MSDIVERLEGAGAFLRHERDEAAAEIKRLRDALERTVTVLEAVEAGAGNVSNGTLALIARIIQASRAALNPSRPSPPTGSPSA